MAFEDNPISLMDELLLATNSKPLGEEMLVNRVQSVGQLDPRENSIHGSAVHTHLDYVISGTEETTDADEQVFEKQLNTTEILSSQGNEIQRDGTQIDRSREDVSGNRKDQIPDNEEISKFIAELYANERKSERNVCTIADVDVHAGPRGLASERIISTDDHMNRKGHTSQSEIPVDGTSHDHTGIESHVDASIKRHTDIGTEQQVDIRIGSHVDTKSCIDTDEGLVCSIKTSPEPITAGDGVAQRESPPNELLFVQSKEVRGETSDQASTPPEYTSAAYSRDRFNGGQPEVLRKYSLLPTTECHVCAELVPLIHRLRRQLARLDSLPLRIEEEGLRQDLSKVFSCLYDALAAREADLLRAVDEVYGVDSTTQDKNLLDEVQNTTSYCEKAMMYSTKTELLELSRVVLYRADELLIKEIAMTPDSGFDSDFTDNDILGVVEEVEVFGKVFNVKDVDDAVRKKLFPKEHTASEGEGDNDVRDGIWSPLPLEDQFPEDILPPGPDYHSLEEQITVSQA